MSGFGKLLYQLGRCLFAALFTIFFRLQIQGRHRIPRTGPVLIVANHISLADPPVLGVAVRRPIRFLAMAELFRHPLLRGFVKAVGCIPVDRSRTDFVAARTAIRCLREGHCVAIFPEGGIRSGPESVLGGDPRLRPGLETIAAVAQAPVLPAIIRGAPAVMRWSNWFRRPTVQVTFGHPFCLWHPPGTTLHEEHLALVRCELLKTVALDSADH